ncbi:MAG: insulinase family protein, partial [Spirochaetota bacterium]|nr:insulinase family protein [Spirochaetota bacterium]
KMQTLGYARSLAMGEFYGDLHYEEKYLRAISRVTSKDIIRVARKYLVKDRLNIAILKPLSRKRKELTKADQIKNHKAKVEKIVLRNGLTLLLKEDKTLPLVSIYGLMNGGYRYENQRNQGVYNLLAETILKGTASKSASKIAEIIDDTGGSINAGAGSNNFSLSGTFLKENFRTGFQLYLDIISSAKFPQNEIQKVKKVILSEIRQRDDDIWRASRYHLRRVRFGGHPYSFDGLGTKQSITSMNRFHLLKTYQNLFAPNNMVLAIYGDINKREILNLISRARGFNIRKGRLPKVQKVKPIVNTIKQTLYKNEKRQQSIVKIMFDGPGIYEKDRIPTMLLSYVFSGIGSRLFNDLRGKRTLAYSTGGFYEGRVDTGLFVFYIGTEPGKRDEAIKGIFEHIDKVKSELITETELNIAKNSAIGTIIKQIQTLRGQAALSARYYKLGLGHNHHLKLIDSIKKVTRQDIMRVAKKYFDTNRYVLSVVESKKAKP